MKRFISFFVMCLFMIFALPKISYQQVKAVDHDVGITTQQFVEVSLVFIPQYTQHFTFYESPIIVTDYACGPERAVELKYLSYTSVYTYQVNDNYYVNYFSNQYLAGIINPNNYSLYSQSKRFTYDNWMNRFQKNINKIERGINTRLDIGEINTDYSHWVNSW